ncbi:MAG: hypothetical protein ACOC9Z_01170 [Chloroflexota bacterium]
MKTVASLFETQAEASEAIDALAGTGFEDIDYRVYERNVEAEGTQVRAIGLPSTEPNIGGSGAVGIFGGPGDDLGDEGLADFFRNAVESGEAVLIVAEVEDDRADDLERFFRDQGGRTSEED